MPKQLPSPQVTGSSGQLQQAAMNLIQNAADACAGRPAPRLEIMLAAHDGLARIDFADDGGGFAAEHRSRVFDPFFTTKAVAPGTGLGLSIGRAIVERHGGTPAAGSAPGQGACFTLRLPPAPEAVA